MRALAGTLLALSLLMQPALAQPQIYPARPVTLVVSLPAGTGMDVIARLYAEKLGQTLGKPLIIEDKPGSTGLVAAESVLTAPADGYTLGTATSSIMAIRPTLFKSRLRASASPDRFDDARDPSVTFRSSWLDLFRPSTSCFSIKRKSWMPGTSPDMTESAGSSSHLNHKQEAAS